MSQLAQEPKPPRAKATGKGFGSQPNPAVWDKDVPQCPQPQFPPFLKQDKILIITLPLIVNTLPGMVYLTSNAIFLIFFFFNMYFSSSF